MYNYTFLSTDPDGDDIRYFVKWGDGNTVPLTSLQASGTALYRSHSWTAQGTYLIEAYAEDRYGCQSDWGTLTVSMPKNKVIDLNVFLQGFLQRFPMFEKLLNQILL